MVHPCLPRFNSDETKCGSLVSSIESPICFLLAITLDRLTLDVRQDGDQVANDTCVPIPLSAGH